MNKIQQVQAEGFEQSFRQQDVVHYQSEIIKGENNNNRIRGIILRSPLSIYYNIHLFQLQQAQNRIIRLAEQQQSQTLNINPLQGILFTKFNISQIKLKNTSVGKKSDFVSQQLSEEQNIQILGVGAELKKKSLTKLHDFFIKKNHHIILYNKFNENILTKTELTLLIRNINDTIRMEMLRKFSSSLAQSVSSSNYYSNQNIQFTSAFESGNLSLVLRQKNIPNTYYLFLQNDTNTHGFNQWFYFGIKSCNRKCRFVIVNISKQFRYWESMRLLSFSQSQGWRKNVPFLYYKNNFERFSGGSLYTIDFQYQFKEKDEFTFFTLNLPYTFTRLNDFLTSLQLKMHYYGLSVKIDTLGKSQVKNIMPYIKIGKNNSKLSFKKKKEKCIIVFARQHPSESVGSFICEKMIELLTQKNSRNEYLLDKYNWYFIPMVNPDGVIHGHSRTNIKGYDVNRCWDKNSIVKTIETENILKLIKQIYANDQIYMSIDLHGHSYKFGSFCYFTQKTQISKVLSYYLCTSQLFNKKQFKWGLTHQKRQTLRGQMYYTFGVKNSLTLETSFYGYLKDEKLIPYTEKEFCNIADRLIEGIWSSEIYKTQLDMQDKKNIMIQIKKMELTWSKKQFDKDDSSSNSSNPQIDYLKQQERSILNLDKNNKFQTSDRELSINIQKPNTQNLLTRSKSEINKKIQERKKIVKNKTQRDEEVKEIKPKVIQRPLSQYKNQKYQTPKIIKLPNERIQDCIKSRKYEIGQIKRPKYQRKSSFYVKSNKTERNLSSKQKSNRSVKYESVIQYRGQEMKSHQITLYPTQSNIIIDLGLTFQKQKQKFIDFLKQEKYKLNKHKIKQLRNNSGFNRDLNLSFLAVSNLKDKKQNI